MSNLVSISLITYNHEAFIEASLKSILTQETDFDFDIVIGEDFSKDNTRKIILDLQQQYPGKIKLIEREHNIGSTRNFSDTLLHCTGEFIAMMDGDDEMLPGKLQEQVDFFRSYPECVMVGHEMKIWTETAKAFTGVLKAGVTKDRKIYELTDFIKHGAILGNSSKMFRRKNMDAVPVDLRIYYIADYYFTIKYLKPGEKVGVIHKPLGVYRVHPNNTMLNLNGKKNLYDLLLAQRYLSNTYNNKFFPLYNRIRSYATWLLGKEYLLNKKYKKAFYFLSISYKYERFVNKSQVVYLIKSYLKSSVWK